MHPTKAKKIENELQEYETQDFLEIPENELKHIEYKYILLDSQNTSYIQWELEKDTENRIVNIEIQ